MLASSTSANRSPAPRIQAAAPAVVVAAAKVIMKDPAQAVSEAAPVAAEAKKEAEGIDTSASKGKILHNQRIKNDRMKLREDQMTLHILSISPDYNKFSKKQKIELGAVLNADSLLEEGASRWERRHMSKKERVARSEPAKEAEGQRRNGDLSRDKKLAKELRNGDLSRDKILAKELNKKSKKNEKVREEEFIAERDLEKQYNSEQNLTEKQNEMAEFGNETPTNETPLGALD